MSQESTNQPKDASTRKLTNLVRILVVLVALNLVATIVLSLAPSLIVSRLNQQFSTPFSTTSITPSEDQFNDFHAWPISKQIDAASLIMRTEYQKVDGRTKCIIVEILKQAPNTKFYYKVGDEFPELGRMREIDKENEDGQIAFFVGSPASMRYATSYTEGHLGGIGRVSIDELRQMIKALPSKRS